MSNVLSRIERDIIVKNLSEDLPLLIIKSVSTRFIPHERHLPQFEPVTIKPKSYSITEEGILFLPLANYFLPIPDKTPVCIFFYYKGRGLFFETSFRIVRQGYALVISPHIFKQLDDSQPFEKQIGAKVFFNTQEKKSLSIDCITHPDIPLFSKDAWQKITEHAEQNVLSVVNALHGTDFQRSIDMFTENKAQNVEEYYSAVNAGLYLSGQTVEIPCVEGRIEPLSLLFISHKELVFGCRSGQIPLYEGNEYAAELSVPVQRIHRTIYITVCVEKIIGSPLTENKKQCALASITSIREEDRRFLYERLYNKIMI